VSARVRVHGALALVKSDPGLLNGPQPTDLAGDFSTGGVHRRSLLQ
jgi:hypothetical protein